MAIKTLGKTPSAITGLTSGSSYTLQNTGHVDIRLHEGASAPSNLSDSFVIKSGEGAKITKSASKNIYVWSAGSPTSHIPGLSGGGEHVSFVVYFESA